MKLMILQFFVGPHEYKEVWGHLFNIHLVIVYVQKNPKIFVDDLERKNKTKKGPAECQYDNEL